MSLVSNPYRRLASCLLAIVAVVFGLGACATNPPEWLTLIERTEVPEAIRRSATDDSGSRRLIWHAYHEQDDGREVAIAAYPVAGGWSYWVGMFEQSEGSLALAHSVIDELPAEEIPFSGAWTESEAGVVAAGLLSDPEVKWVCAQTSAKRPLHCRMLGSFWYIWPNPTLLPGAAPGDEVWHRIAAMGHDRSTRHALPINPLSPSHQPCPKDNEPRWVSSLVPETVPQAIRDHMSRPGAYFEDHIWYAFGQSGDRALVVCSSLMPLNGHRTLLYTLFAIEPDGTYTQLEIYGTGAFPYPRRPLQVGHGFRQSTGDDGAVTATLRAAGVIVDDDAARVVGLTDAGNRAEFEPVNTFFFLFVPNARPNSEEPSEPGDCGDHEKWTEIWVEDVDGNVLHTWQPPEHQGQ